jgi:hypothetical protein
VIILGEHKETGIGRSKKEAKRQAALKLLKEIRKWNEDSTDTNSSQPLQQVKDLKRTIKHIQNTFNVLRNSCKPVIRSLIANKTLDEDNGEFNSKLLNELCAEQMIELVYIPAPTLSLKGPSSVTLAPKTRLDHHSTFISRQPSSPGPSQSPSGDGGSRQWGDTERSQNQSRLQRPLLHQVDVRMISPHSQNL